MVVMQFCRDSLLSLAKLKSLITISILFAVNDAHNGGIEKLETITRKVLQ